MAKGRERDDRYNQGHLSGREAKRLQVRHFEAHVCYYRGMAVISVRHRWSKQVVKTWCVPASEVHIHASDALAEVDQMALRREAAGPGQVEQGPEPDEGFKGDYPYITEYLYSGAFEDGTPRQRSTITLMAGDVHGLKCVLNDREQARSLWVTAPDLVDLMETLEHALASEKPSWKFDKAHSGQGPHKRGK